MKIKIGRRALSALPAVTRPTIFYDTDLTGFGLKASPTPSRSSSSTVLEQVGAPSPSAGWQ
jgi:hypothetical protein